MSDETPIALTPKSETSIKEEGAEKVNRLHNYLSDAKEVHGRASFLKPGEVGYHKDHIKAYSLFDKAIDGLDKWVKGGTKVEDWDKVQRPINQASLLSKKILADLSEDTTHSAKASSEMTRLAFALYNIDVELGNQELTSSWI